MVFETTVEEIPQETKINSLYDVENKPYIDKLQQGDVIEKHVWYFVLLNWMQVREDAWKILNQCTWKYIDFIKSPSCLAMRMPHSVAKALFLCYGVYRVSNRYSIDIESLEREVHVDPSTISK
jgi:hypothetical protein